MTNITYPVTKRPGRNGRGRKTSVGPALRLETKVFDIYQKRFSSLTEMAKAMGISVSQVYRVRQGKRPIGEKFIIGTMKAFLGYGLGDLFHVVPTGNWHGKK
jgi:transcriptional regulator with XRE-family HTH domain